MALDSDLILDRQRLKRRLTWWRVLAIAAVVVAVFAVTRRSGGGLGSALSAHIERYRINGLIGNGTEVEKDLDKLAADASVSAVLLHLDTPGARFRAARAFMRRCSTWRRRSRWWR